MTQAPTAPVGAILAAGFGTRMKPFTHVVPKPLLPFLNTPLIAYSISHLLQAGVRHIGINLHHLAGEIPPVVDALLQALEPIFGAVKVTYVHEEEARGTAGGIAGIWEAMGKPNTTLISINGDSVMDINLPQVLADHAQSGRSATMLVRPLDGTHAGGLWANDQNEVIGLRHARSEEGGKHFDFMGVHILSPAALKKVHKASQSATQTCMVGDVYIPLLGTPLAPGVLEQSGFWAAMDTPKHLLDATIQVLDDPSLLPQSSFRPTHGKGLAILAPQNIHNDTRLAAPVFLGAFASTAHRTRVGPHVVVDGTHLGPGSRVKESILFGMGHVEGTWDGCVAIRGKIAQVRK